MKTKLTVLCLASLMLTGANVQAISSEEAIRPKVIVIPLGSTQSNVSTTCTAPDEVQSAGQCWKSFNLGATQVAIADNDEAAYGDLYQWGRRADGHQSRDSSITTNGVTNQSPTDVPGHGNFILGSADWRATQNDFFWQGIGGVNNPCPQGFRLPTKKEFENEINSWSLINAAGAYDSPLKLTVGGYRGMIDGLIHQSGTHGYYWYSDVLNNVAGVLQFTSDTADIVYGVRAYGFNVRCIKN